MKNSKVIEELSREKYIEICNETFNWCLKKFGTPIKNTVPIKGNCALWFGTNNNTIIGRLQKYNYYL